MTTFANLVESKYLENTQTAQYTSSAVKTIIDKCVVNNVSASNVQLSVNIIQSGGSAGDNNLIIDAVTIEPGKSYLCPELIGLILESGGFLSTLSSASNALVMNMAGRTI
jgi:hypothetical protein